jgi:hypothetical protein
MIKKRGSLAGYAVAVDWNGQAILSPVGICQILKVKTTGVGFYILSWVRSRDASRWISPFLLLLST